jgi:hypothetical protein
MQSGSGMRGGRRLKRDVDMEEEEEEEGAPAEIS